MQPLHEQQCSGDALALGSEQVDALCREISADWSLSPDRNSISRTFRFGNYYETMAFANVVAQLAHQQDHHPSMTIGYNTCQVEYSTHSVGGLSSYDFICAAKLDRTLSL